MDEKLLDTDRVIEIDIKRLLHAVLSKTWLIAIVAVACAVATFLGTLLLVTPTYQSSIMFYVNNSSGSQDNSSSSVSNADITASRNLVKSYIIILNTKETLNEVIACAGVDLSHRQVKSMVSATAVDSTEIIKITVTSEKADEAEKLANAIVEILPAQINSIIDGTSARVVETADLASKPSSPNYTKNVFIGFALGLILMVIIVAMREIFDNSVRTEADATRSGEKPMLGMVPDMRAHSKGGYRKIMADDAARAAGGNSRKLVGQEISYAASEAYKILRTKLLFSFTDEKSCHIVGVSSAITGEGKSLTTVNLAYSLSQLGKRVLLIDCDMRRPSVADKLPIKKHPGLSDYLSGQTSAEKLIQLCNIKGDESAFHVISAGQTPPNPMELLSSNKMERTLNQLRTNYDYILLDLPPVCEVGDPLAVAKGIDGTLLVVRQGYCNRRALNAAIRQFEFVGAKILGVVLNCATENSNAYSRKYYRRYGNKYYRAYCSAYTSAAMGRSTENTTQG